MNPVAPMVLTIRTISWHLEMFIQTYTCLKKVYELMLRWMVFGSFAHIGASFAMKRAPPVWRTCIWLGKL